METALNQQLTDFKNKLQEHPAFNSIQSLAELKIFSAYHIFLVWDYMSLLKSLQTQLTCIQTPWKPVQSPYTRYLINSLVLKAESDIAADGNYASHYEMYRDAMQAMNADTGLMDNLMAHIETDICGDDKKKWHEATQAANQSLRNRIRLFDYIHERIVAVKN